MPRPKYERIAHRLCDEHMDDYGPPEKGHIYEFKGKTVFCTGRGYTPETGSYPEGMQPMSDMWFGKR